MSTNKTSAICPQCGAQGTAGRFCEYCGTKIPMPVAKAIQNNESTPFSWYDVIPQGYKISENHVIGNSHHSLFMVVEADRDDKKSYGIIDRKGKFVIDCNNIHVNLFSETNYCILIKKDNKFNKRLQNLETGNVIYEVTDLSMIGSIYGSSSLISINDQEKGVFSLFDTQREEFISLPSEMSSIKNIEGSVYPRLIDGKLEIVKTERVSDKDKTKTIWHAIIENGQIKIIDEVKEAIEENSGTGCLFVLLLPLLLPLALLYLL